MSRQAAYDSLPWLEGETLVRHVLSATHWGQALAQSFSLTHDSRADLFRQADIFAGFDNEGIEELVQVADGQRARPLCPTVWVRSRRSMAADS